MRTLERIDRIRIYYRTGIGAAVYTTVFITPHLMLARKLDWPGLHTTSSDTIVTRF